MYTKIIYIYMCRSIYIRPNRKRERERETHTHIYISRSVLVVRSVLAILASLSPRFPPLRSEMLRHGF